jgi:hypothetical protein
MKDAIRFTAENTVKQRNPVAAALRCGQFRKQVLRDRTKYSRKGRKRGQD